MIQKLPNLKVLDFKKVKQAERDRAKRLSQSAAGAALEGDVQLEARQSKDTTTTEPTFHPGEGNSAQESFVTQFTSQQKMNIRAMIANATSPAEIERIEASVKKGIYPTPTNETTPTPVSDPSENQTMTSEEANHKKRKITSPSKENKPSQPDESPARRTRSSTNSCAK